MDAPSRPASKGCKWEKLSDAALGLEAWVSRCDYGFRKIDFVPQSGSLAVRFSDGGAPEPVVDVLDLAAGETAEAGIRRVFLQKTDPAVAKRCVLAPFRGAPRRKGVVRSTFVPDAAYAAELAKTASPDELPEPPCGEWGEAPDGIQYFEAHPGSAAARRVLFVRVGQDTPLFDEASLKILPR